MGGPQCEPPTQDSPAATEHLQSPQRALLGVGHSSPPWHGLHPAPAASRALWHGQCVEHDPCTPPHTLPHGKGLLCPFALTEAACDNPRVRLLSNNHPQRSAVLVKGCDSPPQARAPHHGIRPPS